MSQNSLLSVVVEHIKHILSRCGVPYHSFCSPESYVHMIEAEVVSDRPDLKQPVISGLISVNSESETVTVYLGGITTRRFDLRDPSSISGLNAELERLYGNYTRNSIKLRARSARSPT